MGAVVNLDRVNYTDIYIQIRNAGVNALNAIEATNNVLDLLNGEGKR